MSDKPKIECKVCGKMITDMPVVIANHAKTHDKADAKPVDAKPVVGREGKDGVYRGGTPDDVNIKKIMETALRAQDERRAAPEIAVAELSQDENTVLVRKYCPDAVDKFKEDGTLRNERHAYFVEYRELGLKASQGYVPVLDFNGQLVRNSGGDALTTIDSSRYNAAKAKAMAESKARFKTPESLLRNAESKSGGTTAGINVEDYSADIRTA
jgi:hypothetical protein